MPKKCSIFISKQKHNFLHVLLSASMKLLSETQSCLSISKLHDLEGWTEMGHTFSWKCGSVNFLLSYMWKLEHIYPEKQQDNNKKDNSSKQMEGDDARRGQGCTKLKLAWGLNFKINFRPDFHAILCCLVRTKMFILFWVIYIYVYRLQIKKK